VHVLLLQSYQSGCSPLCSSEQSHSSDRQTVVPSPRHHLAMAIILALPPGSGTPSVLARQFSPILPTVCQLRRSPAPALLAAGRWARSGSFGGSFTASVIAPLRMCPPLECAQGSAAATAAPPATFTQKGFEAFLLNLQSSICDEVNVAGWISCGWCEVVGSRNAASGVVELDRFLCVFGTGRQSWHCRIERDCLLKLGLWIFFRTCIIVTGF
jgi:hypothetical protein